MNAAKISKHSKAARMQADEKRRALAELCRLYRLRGRGEVPAGLAPGYITRLEQVAGMTMADLRAVEGGAR